MLADIGRSISYLDFPMKEEDLIYWNCIYSKYIHLNVSLSQRMIDIGDKYTKDRKVLGVYIRAAYRWGGLLKNRLYYQHPKVNTCEYYIDEINKRLNEWNYQYFFLVCEDREYSDKIFTFFKDKCLRIERPLYHYFQQGEPLNREYINVEFQNYSMKEKTEDYLMEVYTLASCDALYTCIGTGAQVAYLINGGKYEHLEVENNGLWNKNDLGIE